MAEYAASLPPDFLRVVLRCHELVCATETQDPPHSGLDETGGRGRIEMTLAGVEWHHVWTPRLAGVVEKAAYILAELVRMHPFVDGNKRTGLLATVDYLLWNGRPLTNTGEEAACIRRIADAQDPTTPDHDEIVRWIADNSQELDVAERAQTSRFRRSKDLEFSLRLHERVDDCGRGVVLDVDALDPATHRRIGGGPFWRLVWRFRRLPKTPRQPPLLAPVEEDALAAAQRRAQRKRQRERAQRANKHKRRKRRGGAK